MNDFLHGVETVSIDVGPRPIREVRTAIIFLVGTAPIHHVAAPPDPLTSALSLSDRDDPKWGPDLPGYTIPQALAAIHGKVQSTVIVHNVFDPTEHHTDVAAADLAIAGGEIELAHGDVLNVVVKAAGGEGPNLVLGTDYTLDTVEGVITVVPGGALNAASQANVAYSYGNPAAVQAADIIGDVDESGFRTGLQAALSAAAQFGFGPKLLIAPGYSQLEGVRAAMVQVGTQLRAHQLVDVPLGTLREEVIEGRGPEGDVDLTTADRRLIYCYPHVKAFDRRANANRLEPLSQHAAGVLARTDRELGYWHSPSNKQITGIVGLELPLTASINDPSSDVNQINAAGVMTVFAGHGKGLRLWGNRSSAFPGSSGLMTFIAPQRVRDIIDESIELAAMDHLDGPIDDVFIKAVLEDVGEFIRKLIGRRAILKGSRVIYDPADNPVSDLADGKIVFTNIFCPPPPAERIVWKSVVDTTLLANLV
jgi:phage tail sheath protein FI